MLHREAKQCTHLHMHSRSDDSGVGGAAAAAARYQHCCRAAATARRAPRRLGYPSSLSDRIQTADDGDGVVVVVPCTATDARSRPRPSPTASLSLLLLRSCAQLSVLYYLLVRSLSLEREQQRSLRESISLAPLSRTTAAVAHIYTYIGTGTRQRSRGDHQVEPKHATSSLRISIIYLYPLEERQ